MPKELDCWCWHGEEQGTSCAFANMAMDEEEAR